MLKRKRFIIGGLIILAALSYIIYGGMQQAIVYFVTPSELKAKEHASADKFLRMGGMVVTGSLQKDLKNLTYRFDLTDGNASFAVFFAECHRTSSPKEKVQWWRGALAPMVSFRRRPLWPSTRKNTVRTSTVRPAIRKAFSREKSQLSNDRYSTSHFAALDSALTGLAAITFPPFSKTLAMSPTLSFSNAALVLLESVVILTSLSFVLTVSLPAFASTDVTLPVRTVA